MLTVRCHTAPSAIHGVGLFADEFIRQGTVIWIYAPGIDISLPAQWLDSLPSFEQRRLRDLCYVTPDTNEIILCGDDARFMNHCDEPNTISGDPDAALGVTLAARDIAAGEELTCDYREFDADSARKLSWVTPETSRP